MAAACPTAEAAWLQDGYDAARTGNTPDPAPVAPDIALIAHLPGTPDFGAAVLVKDGMAYLRTRPGATWDLTLDGVVRVNLLTGDQDILVNVTRKAKWYADGPFASDGQRLFLTAGDRFEAYSLAGALLWSVPVFRPLTHVEKVHCGSIAVHQGLAIIPCTTYGSAVDPSQPGASLTTYREAEVAWVTALDAATGATRWRWVEQDERTNATERLRDGRGAPWATASPLTRVVGFAVVDHHVILRVMDTVGDKCPATDPTAPKRCLTGNPEPLPKEDHGFAALGVFSIWGIDAESGRSRWTTNGTAFYHLDGNRVSYFPGADFRAFRFPGGFTGLGGRLFARIDQDLAWINSATGEILDREPLRVFDPWYGDTGAHFAAADDDLVVLQSRSIHHLNPFRKDDHGARWTATVDAPEIIWWQYAAIADGIAFLRTYDASERPANISPIYAFDVETGARLWKLTVPVPANSREFAVAEGYLVAPLSNGAVLVIGRNEASLGPVLVTSEEYPPPGREVRVDLSGSRPGWRGAAVESRADWGDGTASEWNSTLLHRHTFAVPGDQVARFEVRNALGETASATVTFHVGATRPAPDVGEILAANGLPNLVPLVAIPLLWAGARISRRWL